MSHSSDIKRNAHSNFAKFPLKTTAKQVLIRHDESDSDESAHFHRGDP